MFLRDYYLDHLCKFSAKREAGYALKKKCVQRMPFKVAVRLYGMLVLDDLGQTVVEKWCMLMT